MNLNMTVGQAACQARWLRLLNRPIVTSESGEKACGQGCGSGYFVNRFRFHTYRFRFQQNLDSISSMNLLASMTIITSSLRFYKGTLLVKMIS